MEDYDADAPPWFAEGVSLHSVRKLVIADGVTHVGDNAFNFGKWGSGDYVLSEITMADSVASIGKFSFIGIPSVTLLTVPVNIDLLVDSGGDRDPAFRDTSSIGKIVFTPGSGEKSGQGYDYGNRGRVLSPQYLSRESLTEVVFSENITSTGEDVLFGCYKVSSLALPSTLTAIN